VYKLVYLDPVWAGTDGQRCRVSPSLACTPLLRAEHTEVAGSPRVVRCSKHACRADRRRDVRVALSLAGVARKLFTYEGSGTYAPGPSTVRSRSWGSTTFMKWSAVQRAEQAATSNRDATRHGRLLLYGYGARLGPASMEPAGSVPCCRTPTITPQNSLVCLPLRATRGGVGGRLVEALVQEAHRQGADVCVCLYHPGRRQRCLFGRDSSGCSEAVAAEKWHGYDPARRDQVAVYRRDLAHTQH